MALKLVATSPIAISTSKQNRLFAPLLVVAVHLVFLGLALGLFPHISTALVEQDKIMNVFEVSELPPSVPEEKTPPPASVPIPDPNALAIPVDPQTPVDPNTSTNTETSGNADPEYIPQFKLSALPQIPEREFRSRVIYPPLAAQQGIQATVILLIYVDSNGKIRKIAVLKDPGYGFAEAAVKALEGMTVRPAEINGAPVASQFRQSIPFHLK